MNQAIHLAKTVRATVSVLGLIGLLVLFTHLAFAGRPLTEEDFAAASLQGFGDRANGWAWAMQWWDGYLYVSTNHDWRCGEILAQARNSFGIFVYPDDDPDVECPEDPLELDMRAEIWRWHAETNVWEQVYQAPFEIFTEYTQLGGSITDPITVTVEISPTPVARDIGYRGMTLFQEPDGTVALYVTSVSPAYLGYKVPPRILRSVDGVNFEAIPQDPGTPLGDILKTSLRNPTVHVGSDGIRRLYVQAGSSKGSGAIFESADPSLGNEAWRKISPDEIKYSHMLSFNGALYMGARNPANGFEIHKYYPDGGRLPYRYKLVMEQGGYSPSDNPNVEILSMQEFQGRLYIGGNGIVIGFLPSANTSAEMFRINPDDSWDLVAGEPRLEMPDGSPPKYPLSGLGGGFGNDNAGHIWRMEDIDEHLYITTFDGSVAAKDEEEIPEDVLAQMGFDLWRTSNGVDYTAVTTNGLSALIEDPDPPRPDLNLGTFDAGGRSLSSNPYGFFVGTANYYYGLRIWRAFIPTPPTTIQISHEPTGVVNTSYSFLASTLPVTTTLTHPLTYTWEVEDHLPVTFAGGLESSLNFSWDTPGNKTVEVTVSNEYGTVTSNSSIEIGQDSAGIPLDTITLDIPLFGGLNEPITLQANIVPVTATQPVTYTWSATDQGTMVRASGANDIVSYTWQSAGTKSVTVLVTNGLDTALITKEIDIATCEPIETARLFFQTDGELFVGSPAFFELLAYGGTAPYNYEWKVDGEPIGANHARLYHTFDTEGIHKIEGTISNSCGKQTVSHNLLVSLPTEDQPTANLSTSGSYNTRLQFDNGQLITYTLILRNTSDTTTTLTLDNPIPPFTEYITNSVRSTDSNLAGLIDDSILWQGEVISGTPIIIAFAVRVTDTVLPANTQIVNQSFLTDEDGQSYLLETSSTYVAGYYLNINNIGRLFSRNAIVSLFFGWNPEDNITQVKFSNYAGFGDEPQANTTNWIDVDQLDGIYPNWALNLEGSPSTARTIYAMFRDSSGEIVNVVASDQRIYDAVPPEILSAEIVPDSPGSQYVHVNVTALDDNSGVRYIWLSHLNAEGVEILKFSGPTDSLPWKLDPSGTMFLLAQDGASNFSPIMEIQGPEAVEITGVDVVIGPETGYTNQSYNFFLLSDPVSVTHPITYVWDVTDHAPITHVSDQNDYLALSWDTPGTKLLNFTATNVLGTVSGSYTIEISVAPPPTPTSTPSPSPTATNTPTPTATPSPTPTLPPPTMYKIYMPALSRQ